MYAEKMLKERELGKKPFATLYRIARYLFDIEKMNRKQVRKRLELFLMQCEPSASVAKWSDIIDAAVSYAVRHDAVMMYQVDITEKEMAAIDSLDGRQIKRLAFTLLCLAKYWNYVNKTDDGWVNTPDNEIMKLANINTSLKRQAAMYTKLKQLGFIETSTKVDNTNVRVTFFGDDRGNHDMAVKDFRNLGYQYLKHVGEPSYYVCTNCGLTSKMKGKGVGRPPRYCPECAQKIKIQQTMDKVMRKTINRNK